MKLILTTAVDHLGAPGDIVEVNGQDVEIVEIAAERSPA